VAIENYEQVDVFIGVDVGKGEHHAVALDRAGRQLYDKALPNDGVRCTNPASQPQVGQPQPYRRFSLAWRSVSSRVITKVDDSEPSSWNP
jgi:hypothetical protein